MVGQLVGSLNGRWHCHRLNAAICSVYENEKELEVGGGVGGWRAQAGVKKLKFKIDSLDEGAAAPAVAWRL